MNLTNVNSKKTDCSALQAELPGLLLDPSAVADPGIAMHLGNCDACGREYRSLQETMALLDQWTAPEPTPYFDQKMAVRLREEIAAPPMGWFERLQARLALNANWRFQPVMAGALAAALIVGAGAFAGFRGLVQPQPVEASSAVKDLQILDRNEQAFQQMDQLLQDDDAGTSAQDPGPAAPPIG